MDTTYFKSSLFEKCLQCFVKYETKTQIIINNTNQFLAIPDALKNFDELRLFTTGKNTLYS